MCLFKVVVLKLDHLGLLRVVKQYLATNWGILYLQTFMGLIQKVLLAHRPLFQVVFEYVEVASGVRLQDLYIWLRETVCAVQGALPLFRLVCLSNEVLRFGNELRQNSLMVHSIIQVISRETAHDSA